MFKLATIATVAGVAFSQHVESGNGCTSNEDCATGCCTDIQGSLSADFCFPKEYCANLPKGVECTYDVECSSLSC